MPTRAWSLVRFLASLVFVAIAVVAAVEWTSPRRGGLSHVVGVDDRHAIVVRSFENRPGTLLELVTLDGHIRWSKTLPDVMTYHFGHPLITESGEALVVRSAFLTDQVRGDEGRLDLTPRVTAFGVHDGRFIWQRSPLEHLVGEGGFLGPWTSQLADDQMVYEVYESLGARLLVISRDVESGREMWRFRSRRTTTAVGPAWLAAGHLVLVDLHAIRVLDADTGQEVRRIPILGTDPCLAGDEVYFTHEGQLRLLSLTNLEDRSLDLSGEFAEDEDRYLRLHGQCGRHGELVILAFDSTVVALDVENVELDWQLDIDEATFADVAAGRDIRRRFPLSVPFSGELTRYVPVLMRGSHPLLVMLDLEEGDIVQSSPPTPTLENASFIRRGTLHYLVQSDPEPSLTVFDGATGELLASKKLGPFHNPPTWVAPHHFISDRLVLYSTERWIVVDGLTLEPVSDDAELEDALETATVLFR